MKSFRLVAILVPVLMLAACGFVGGRTYDTVSLRVIEQDDQTIAFVPVSISGQGPFLFALDTGASSTVVATDIALQLGLPPTGERRQITGVVGTRTEQVVIVEDWSIGDVALDPADVVAIDLPSPEGEGLQGLLGSDILSGFGKVLVDYNNEKLGLLRD